MAHGLQVPKKRSRKRIATGRRRPIALTKANSVWGYDFVFDGCAIGQQLKCLAMVDEFTRKSLAIDEAGSIRSARAIDVLSKLITVRGAPRYLCSDNGPEFASVVLLKWIVDWRIESALIDPGKPWQNGTTERFNGKFRDECLVMNVLEIGSKRSSRLRIGASTTTRCGCIQACDTKHQKCVAGSNLRVYKSELLLPPHECGIAKMDFQARHWADVNEAETCYGCIVPTPARC
jgi:transposase InsO family protein